MITNNSLKEYYVKLQELYDNALNLLTGINQSLSTTASEITVPIIKDNYIESEVRIPSFLYLENKLEQLSTNFSNLFSMPNSGDAWLTNNSSQFKLQMVRANTAPVAPRFSTSNIFASITDNNFLKDLVSPKTFLKINIDNLPLGTESMMMKKMVIYTANMYEALVRLAPSSYNDVKELLDNYTKGSDYDEYDSEIQMPCRRDKYRSEFKLIELPESTNGIKNPWLDSSSNKLTYQIHLDTITYYDKDDNAITFAIKPGDYLVLGNTNNIYRVKSVDTSEMLLEIEEYIGHTILQNYNENPDMVFQIYNSSYSEYDYIQVPLEENQYIIVFLASVYNNVQSTWSAPSFFDLSKIFIKDAGGNFIEDENGNKLSYLDYYNKYCVNIGDLILGLTQTAYPQVSNYTPNVLQSLQDSSEAKEYVSATWDNEVTLQVVPINKHLTDDVSSEEIMNLHAQKNDINAALQTNQANIDGVYNKLLTTDFSNQVMITQTGLQEDLNHLYTERTSLQKQLNAVIDSINAKSLDIKTSGNDVKYRVRGVTNVEHLEEWLHSVAGDKTELVGLEVQYKYKSPLKDTNTVTNINSSIFTDWVQQSNIERERRLVFAKNGTTGFGLEYVDYSATNNIIKWNQIDIPINKGEDVVIRIRYKYNVGQPFINIYSPWSEELIVSFPPQFQDDVELETILDANRQDTVKAGFNKVLIDEGYEEHIHNKMISNEQTFFHLPENIYSGFNTPENNLISLKDKLLSLNSEIEKWKTLLDNETNSKFEVYINYDGIDMLLTPNANNQINIYNTDHASNAFIKKEMNLVIKNTGDVRLNLYSIFPGNTSIPLINTNEDYYNDRIGNYERVPIYINENISGQYLGQWIYFRSNNPWTKKQIYYETQAQNASDLSVIMNFDEDDRTEAFEGLPYMISADAFMSLNNKQAMLAFRNRMSNSNYITNSTNGIKWSTLVINNPEADKLEDLVLVSKQTSVEYTNSVIDDVYNKIEESTMGSINWFIYPLTTSNKFITRFEDICGIKRDGNKLTTIYLDKDTNISTFIENYSPENFKDETSFGGAFLFPNIQSKELIMTEGSEKNSKYIEVGETLTIPIVFEYFCGDTLSSISKSLYFDLRNSLVSDPKHFMIEVIGHNDYTSSNDIYTNNINNIGQDEASSPDVE